MSKLDRRITFFRLKEDKNGVVTKVIVYKDVFAAFRQLSDAERVTTTENGSQSTCRFEVNKLDVTKDMYVSFNRPIFGETVYQVTSIDPFHGHERHIVVGCKEVQHALKFTNVEEPS